MCEFCNNRRANWERGDAVPGSEAWTCDEEGCGRNAGWRTIFAYVDDHYCDSHRGEKDEPEVPEFSEPAEGYGADYLLPIRKAEPCAGPILGPSCGNPARWARVTRGQTFACDQHRPKQRTQPKELAR